jgi:ketosteroid isomerase-like protein
MSGAASPSGPLATVERLRQAIDDHDLDALVACFSADYVNETPAHPDRSFTGSAQVRQNWQGILAAVPDLRARLVDFAVDGPTVWCEWDWSGTRRDGAEHRMRGVTLTEVRDGSIVRTRFFMEPVSRDGIDASAAVTAVMGAGAPGTGR